MVVAVDCGLLEELCEPAVAMHLVVANVAQRLEVGRFVRPAPRMQFNVMQLETFTRVILVPLFSGPLAVGAREAVTL
jgi:hypothetical protein